MVHGADGGVAGCRPTEFRLYKGGTVHPPSRTVEVAIDKPTDVSAKARRLVRGYHCEILETVNAAYTTL